MNSSLIRQAIVVPLGAMLVAILTGIALSGYSSVSQHMSEMTVLDHPAALITRTAFVVAGISILLFSFGVFVSAPRHYGFTALASGLFGVSMLFNGLFVMGNPLHGLYGLAMISVLVPAFFAAELQVAKDDLIIRRLSMAVSLFNLVYTWLMFLGFDPEGFHGLTQRIAILVLLSWYSLAGYALLRGPTAPSKGHLLAASAADG